MDPRDHGVRAVVAFFLSTQADRIGRRRLLLITIAGYTVCGALTALSPGLLWLTVAQFGTQVFLGAEWAVAITIVVEEFPRDERGKALGLVTSMNTLGGIFVGILAFVGLQDTPIGWRAFFVVGLIPLILIAIGRRSMLETERYEAVRSEPAEERLDLRPQSRRGVVPQRVRDPRGDHRAARRRPARGSRDGRDRLDR